MNPSMVSADSRAVDPASVVNLLHEHQTFLAADLVENPVIPDSRPVGVFPPLQFHHSRRKRVIL